MRSGLATLGIKLEAGAEGLFLEFFGLLTEAGAYLNLTAIREPDEAAVKHFVDSLALLRWVCLRESDRLLDLGSGAGFPGIPLAVAVPDCRVFLLEAVRKKCLFLESAVRQLGLKNATVLCGRAEEYGHLPEYREQFGWVVARGVAPLRELAEYALPFVGVGGYFIAYKGPRGVAEMEAAQGALELLGGRVEKTATYSLPRGEQRVLVFVRKEKPTPAEFPRRAGVARKRPL
ncbi:16S rRNA (guanine(527)-N(7))-methyltransferase RsmG [Thermodesulfitimonas sp.]